MPGGLSGDAQLTGRPLWTGPSETLTNRLTDYLRAWVSADGRHRVRTDACLGTAGNAASPEKARSPRRRPARTATGHRTVDCATTSNPPMFHCIARREAVGEPTRIARRSVAGVLARSTCRSSCRTRSDRLRTSLSWAVPRGEADGGGPVSLLWLSLTVSSTRAPGGGGTSLKVRRPALSSHA